MTEVVAALIWDGYRFLACQRPAHKARGLLWEFVGGKVEPGESREEALSSIATSLDEIQAVAEKVVRENGYDYPVSVYLGEEEYPTKNYESACFPAGEYSSLQIKIGDADGKNWWCVLFPTLCLSSAKGAEQAFVEVGLSTEQYKIITETDDPKYKLRFKILESIEGMF